MKFIVNYTGFIVGGFAGLLAAGDWTLLTAMLAMYTAGLCCANISRDALDRKYGHH